jgi:hypothetical protein
MTHPPLRAGPCHFRSLCLVVRSEHPESLVERVALGKERNARSPRQRSQPVTAVAEARGLSKRFESRHWMASDAWSEPARVRHVIGLAGQSASVEPAMTGRENLEFTAGDIERRKVAAGPRAPTQTQPRRRPSSASVGSHAHPRAVTSVSFHRLAKSS